MLTKEHSLCDNAYCRQLNLEYRHLTFKHNGNNAPKETMWFESYRQYDHSQTHRRTTQSLEEVCNQIIEFSSYCFNIDSCSKLADCP